MKSNTQFSIRLANGREETFETAAAMAAWVTLQRQLDRAPISRSGRRYTRRSPRFSKDGSAVVADEPPLLRYTNSTSSRA